jgi:hypothetical protein
MAARKRKRKARIKFRDELREDLRAEFDQLSRRQQREVAAISRWIDEAGGLGPLRGYLAPKELQHPVTKEAMSPEQAALFAPCPPWGGASPASLFVPGPRAETVACTRCALGARRSS